MLKDKSRPKAVDILNQFKKIGVVFENGIVRAKELVAEKITADIGIFKKKLCLDDTEQSETQNTNESESTNVETPMPSPSESPFLPSVSETETSSGQPQGEAGVVIAEPTPENITSEPTPEPEQLELVPQTP